MLVTVVGVVVVVFFFKQKTAYEMRISDWSSDVCSSDLAHRVGGHDSRGNRTGGDTQCADIPPGPPREGTARDHHGAGQWKYRHAPSGRGSRTQFGSDRKRVV